jgi:hypothetical integral membrane protein (TIGR02206 family)
MTAPFDLSTEHLAALASVTAVAVGLCAAARRRPGRWIVPAAVILGGLTAGSEAAWVGSLVARGAWTPATGLPLHLCDAATALAAAALWTRRRWLVELLWFWALAGASQALLTPDVPDRFPGPLWFQYYVAHGGIVAAAAFLVVGMRLGLGRGAVARSAALTAAYAAVIGGVDLVTGGDYMYLRRPPLSPTLLAALGPWPWYLVSAAALGLALFLLLDAPFRAGRARGGRSGRDARVPGQVMQIRPGADESVRGAVGAAGRPESGVGPGHLGDAPAHLPNSGRNSGDALAHLPIDSPRSASESQMDHDRHETVPARPLR